MAVDRYFLANLFALLILLPTTSLAIASRFLNVKMAIGININGANNKMKNRLEPKNFSELMALRFGFILIKWN